MTRAKLTLPQAISNVGRYNAAESYQRLDAAACKLFSVGLPDSEQGLRAQLEFTARDYQGVNDREALDRVLKPNGDCDLAAKAILDSYDAYKVALRSAEWPCSPDTGRPVLSELFSPFKQGSRWIVWAAKTWHFWRPNTFPILDSRAEAQLWHELFGVAPSQPADPLDRYIVFCGMFDSWTTQRRPWLHSLRDADGPWYTSDLKLWDKVLFMQDKQ